MYCSFGKEQTILRPVYTYNLLPINFLVRNFLHASSCPQVIAFRVSKGGGRRWVEVKQGGYTLT